jgi:hypothetical protein
LKDLLFFGTKDARDSEAHGLYLLLVIVFKGFPYFLEGLKEFFQVLWRVDLGFVYDFARFIHNTKLEGGGSQIEPYIHFIF